MPHWSLANLHPIGIEKGLTYRVRSSFGTGYDGLGKWAWVYPLGKSVESIMCIY
jgi:hypothetical protein